MASGRIKGISIEIDGNTTKLQDSLKDVDKSLSTTKSSLKDVEKLLKFDPGNTTLLAQQQEYLQDIIEKTKERLGTLNQFMEEHGDALPDDQYQALQREIVATEGQLGYYEQQLAGVEDASEGAGESTEDLGDSVEDSGKKASDSGSGGWTIFKDIVADLAKNAIKNAVQGLKDLGKAMVDSVKDSAAFADEVNTLSTQTGMSTDSIQELMYASELMDVDFGTIQKSTLKLTNAMQSAQGGSGAAAESFAALGVSVTDSNGELRSSQDVFYDVIDALGTVENQTERDALAYDLFGRSSEELNSLVAIGSDGMKAYADEAHEMGAVMDSEALGGLNDVSDAMARMDQATLVVQRNFASALAPAVSAVGEAFAEMSADADWQDIFSELGESVAEILPDLINMAKSVLPAIIEVVRQLMPTVSQIISYLPELQPLIDAVVMVIQRLTPMIMKLVSQLLPPLIDIIVAILPILEPILDILEPLLDILGPLLSVVLSALSIALKALVQIISGTLQPVIELLRKAAEKIAPVFENMGQTLQNVQHTMGNAWTAIQNGAKNALNAVKTAVTTAWNNIKSTTTSVWNNIKSAITTPVNAARDAVKTAVDRIKSFFSNLRIKLPNIKVPHFNLTGSFSFVPPRVPKLSVEWYAKAMDEGLILNSPQIFGMMNGRLLGGGEAGQEAVIGTQSLRQMIRDAVGETNNVNIVVYGAVGQDVSELADIIEDRINANINRRRVAF